jgi:hypothetical protein
MNKILAKYSFPTLLVLIFILMMTITSCKSRKQIQKTPSTVAMDSGRCRLDFKSAKALTGYLKDNAFTYDWVYAKANVEAKIDSEENSFDIRVRIKKDSAMLITIQALSMVDVAKILITRDSVFMRVDIRKQYFKGDFNYINELLNADLDYDVIQALLFGNYAEFDEDDTKMKPVTDRQNCRYLLSTERKRKLRKITQGQRELRKSLQTMTLNPDNFKILKNEFVDAETNRKFTASYDNFIVKDSVYAPRLVNIDIVAEKKVKVKIDYVRIEKNQPQKLNLNIPAKYDPIPIKKSK